MLIATHLHRTSNPFTATFRLNFREERQMRQLARDMLEVGLADVADELATSLPTASSAALKSPGRWPPGRSFCCWTSRLPA